MADQANHSGSNPFTTAANNALWSLQDRRGTNAANSSPASLPQTLFTNPPAQPSSVINLSNSTDVVIGPMTQYQGPVTIYQYMDATVETRSTTANGGITQSKQSANVQVQQKLNTTSKLLIFLIVLVLIIAGIYFYVEWRKSHEIPKSAPILFGNNYEHGTFPNLGNGHLVVDRVQWGASDLAKKPTIPLKHPIPYVLITHIGVQSQPCYNIYKCSIKMRTIQDSAIAEKNLTDIQGNFYVADDGNIYVGRGWDWANTYANQTLAITFMGDYGRYIPSESQLEATQYLLAYALTNKYISLDYKLVPQNQTKISKSPGANVIKVIKNWPHYDPCGMPGYKYCGEELNMPKEWNANI